MLRHHPPLFFSQTSWGSSCWSCSLRKGRPASGFKFPVKSVLGNVASIVITRPLFPEQDAVVSLSLCVKILLPVLRLHQSSCTSDLDPAAVHPNKTGLVFFPPPCLATILFIGMKKPNDHLWSWGAFVLLFMSDVNNSPGSLRLDPVVARQNWLGSDCGHIHWRGPLHICSLCR